jgi:hypothetical protein
MKSVLCLLIPFVTLFFALAGFSQSVPDSAGAPVDGRVAEWMYGENIPAIATLPFIRVGKCFCVC